jgi:hypothetical protein
MTPAKHLIAPGAEFFDFCGHQIQEAFLQFPLKQIRAEADFLQNGLHILYHVSMYLGLLTDFKVPYEVFSTYVALFWSPLRRE